MLIKHPKMSVANLVTALTVIFIFSVVFLVAELFFILRHRRFRRPQPSKPTISGDLLCFFCLKPRTRVEPTGAPNSNPNGYPSVDPNIQEIDVFKLLEANRRSRVLCTIKEDDREEVESTSMSVEIVSSVKVSLQTCLESEAAAERAAKVEIEAEGAKTVVVSPPCDSPEFFTPVGTPSRDGVCSEFESPV